MCGEVKSKKDDKTSSTPLVTVTDLQKFKMGEALIKRLRMSPYKTKYVPDFKMDWKEEYPTSDYPTGEMQKVEMFDLKKFVTEKKKEQVMNDDSPRETSSNPFSMGANPFMSRPSPMSSQEMDKMISDIEKKIKEIDEEEAKRKKEKEAMFAPKKEEKPLIDLDDDIEIPAVTNKDEKPKVNVDVDSIIVNDNVISDDEFFDDFFGDDE